MHGMTFAYLAERASHHPTVPRKNQMSKQGYLHLSPAPPGGTSETGRWLLANTKKYNPAGPRSH